MRRFVLQLLACVAAGALWGVYLKAHAQDTDTACGAPATGKRVDTGLLVTLDAAGAQYLRVGPDGYWRFCEAVEIKREPRPCLVPRGNQWTVGQHRCTSPNGGWTVAHGAISPGIVAVGRTEGVLVLQCVDGALSTRLATCSPIQRCEGQHTITDDGGRTVWRWGGILAIGARDVAVSDDGDTRPVECQSNGTMRLL